MRARTGLAGARTFRLDRYAIDRVARAVARGQRGLGSPLDSLADSIASQMTQKLAAAGVRSVGAQRRTRVALDRETRLSIIARVGKHLPVVTDATANGSPHPR